jgi:hypothetical protein
VTGTTKLFVVNELGDKHIATTASTGDSTFDRKWKLALLQPCNNLREVKTAPKGYESTIQHANNM